MQNEYCSLCFAPCANLFEPVDEDAKEALAELLPHLDIKTENDPLVACTNCSRKLKTYMDFKNNFVQAQASIRSFGTERNISLVDPRQVYLQNKDNGSEVSSLEDLVVCRFCLKQATGAYTPLVEEQKEVILVTIMMGKCFPGLELGTISGYDVCACCYETLEESYNFISSLDLENYIKYEDEVMEFEEGPEAKTVQFVSNKFESGDDYVDLNSIKEEDLFTPNGHDFDRGIEVTAEVVGTGGNVYDRIEEVVNITKAEEYCPNAFGDDACDVQREQAVSERSWHLSNQKIVPQRDLSDTDVDKTMVPPNSESRWRLRFTTSPGTCYRISIRPRDIQNDRETP